MTDSNGWTALPYSLENGGYKLVTFFTDIRADMYLKHNLGHSCLYLEAYCGYLNLCRTLLDKYNFDVPMKSNTGWTVLHCPARNSSHRLFTFFADMITGINVKDNLGQICFHVVTLFGHLNLCKKFLDKNGFDVNIMSHEGMRALHYGAKNGSYELLMFFFDLATDIYLKNYSCQNCFHIAAVYKHLNLCNTLV